MVRGAIAPGRRHRAVRESLPFPDPVLTAITQTRSQNARAVLATFLAILALSGVFLVSPFFIASRSMTLALKSVGLIEPSVLAVELNFFAPLPLFFSGLFFLGFFIFMICRLGPETWRRTALTSQLISGLD